MKESLERRKIFSRVLPLCFDVQRSKDDINFSYTSNSRFWNNFSTESSEYKSQSFRWFLLSASTCKIEGWLLIPLAHPIPDSGTISQSREHHRRKYA